MLKWVMHKIFSHIETSYNYDTGYMHEVTDVSAGAAMRYFGLPMLSQMTGPSLDIWAGASLSSVMDGDCGPCAQLVIDNAISAGVSAAALRSCLRGHYEEAGEVGLGYRFATAAIGGTTDLDELRTEIIDNHGELAAISAAYASAVNRAYPVLKRGLGHGYLCQILEVDGQAISVAGGLASDDF